MDPRHIQLVQESLKKVAQLGDATGDMFAVELLRIAPVVAGQDHESLRKRRRRVLGLIATAVQSLHEPEKIQDEVRFLALTNEAGLEAIQPADYDYAGNAFLRTLKKKLGPEFTTDVWDAWVEALCMLTEILLKTVEPPPAVSVTRVV